MIQTTYPFNTGIFNMPSFTQNMNDGIIRVIPSMHSVFLSGQEDWEINNEKLKDRVILIDRLTLFKPSGYQRIVAMIASNDWEMRDLGIKAGWKFLNIFYEKYNVSNINRETT